MGYTRSQSDNNKTLFPKKFFFLKRQTDDLIVIVIITKYFLMLVCERLCRAINKVRRQTLHPRGYDTHPNGMRQLPTGILTQNNTLTLKHDIHFTWTQFSQLV